MNSKNTSLKKQGRREKVIRNSQGAPIFMTHQDMSCDEVANVDVEANLPQSMADNFSDILRINSEEKTNPTLQPTSSMEIDV